MLCALCYALCACVRVNLTDLLMLQLVRARCVQNDVVMVIFRDGPPDSTRPHDPAVWPTNVTRMATRHALLWLN